MSARPATDDTSWPTRLGGYDVVRPLSLGGMGAVLLAERRAPGFTKRVAIKVVLPKLLDDKAALSLFADEARLAARFVHPNLVAVHDFGEEAGVFFMVMELVEGLSVLELLRRRRGPLPVELAAQIIADAARGLSWAHQLVDDDGRPLNVVHRDVSPDNIIIAGVGAVKVLDFGIAKSRMRAQATAVTGLLGKPPYMSPERLRGHVVDERADAWSLGVILHELLTGRRLFTGSGMALMDAVDSGPVAPLPNETPKAVVDVVNAALQRNVKQRATTNAVVEGLDRFLRERGGLRTPAELRAAISAIDPTAWSSSSSSSQPLLAPAGRAADVATADLGAADAGASTLRVSSLSSSSSSTQPTVVTAASRRRPSFVASMVAALLVGVGAVVVVAGLASRAPTSPSPSPIAVPVVVAPPTAAPAPVIEPAPVVEPVPVIEAAVVDPVEPSNPVTTATAPKRAARKPPTPTSTPTSTSTEVGGLYVPDRTPYVDVYVDGLKIGVSPLGSARRPFSMPAGSHVVTLFEPASGKTILTRTVLLVPGAPVVVRP